MKSCMSVLIVLSFCAAGPTALGEVYNLTPPDSGLGKLAHGKYYTWGMDRPWDVLPGGGYQKAAAASLTFNDIRNWNDKGNVLYVHLLDDAPLGITTARDRGRRRRNGDNLDGMGPLLTTYVDLPSTPQTLVYNFTDEQLGLLNRYAADGRFALGFDPNCRFYDSGVRLSIVTDSTQVPEPATVVLLASGLAIGIVGKWRTAARGARRRA